jgi:hypothetical protein
MRPEVGWLFVESPLATFRYVGSYRRPKTPAAQHLRKLVARGLGFGRVYIVSSPFQAHSPWPILLQRCRPQHAVVIRSSIGTGTSVKTLSVVTLSGMLRGVCSVQHVLTSARIVSVLTMTCCLVAI